ncbi:unnamed protein product [Adineta ricciae]|uniref:G-protein coupled receptors family 1 profile domain-containing protein n=1 Tax=Adineta ricciae TaxID=249248 RepID=A0A814NHW4_ADIRI|nr:unnamed protein product [Adineta ricciae]CAF1224638.1 unnamed protein product [Adineta ricciae]
MITLGVIGALLTILVFTRQKAFQRNPTTIYLLAGGIMTAIHLPTIYLQSILVDGFGLGVFNTNEIACREHNYLLYVTTVPTISFPCFAAFDQYASTRREASFRNRWRSLRLVRLLIVSSVVFWALVYIPILFISHSVNNICVMESGVIANINDYFLTPLVYTISPLTFIVVFTWKTVENLRSTFITKQCSKFTKQIRRMLTPQLIVLAISGIPFGLQSVYFNLTNDIPKDNQRQAIEHLFVQINRLFYHCNFVCPFYIYFYMSSEVRKVVKQLMRKFFKFNSMTTLRAMDGNTRTF